MPIARASAVLLALLATLSLLATHSGGARAGGSDPQIVLDEIYGQVAEACSGLGETEAYDLVAIGTAYFEPSLARKVAKASEDGSLDFDVLVDGQDCHVTALDLQVLDETATSAIGRAEFQNFGEPRTVDLVMAKTGGTWTVTDIVYRHRSFSLKTGL